MEVSGRLHVVEAVFSSCTVGHTNVHDSGEMETSGVRSTALDTALSVGGLALPAVQTGWALCLQVQHLQFNQPLIKNIFFNVMLLLICIVQLGL